MKVEKVGKRGLNFILGEGDSPFGFPTAVYMITTEKKVILCDTHVGPKSMEMIKEYIEPNKEVIVFNSHSDYDHVWGNCAFSNHQIIGHELCRKRLIEKGESDLERLKNHAHGDVEIVLPNVTFSERLTIDNEIEFSYAPGHTVCSAMCYDKVDDVLFVGDLVEAPIPYLNHYDYKSFLKTLETIYNHKAKIVVSSHSGVVDRELILKNIEYLREIISIDLNDIDKREDYFNFKFPLILKYEDIYRNQSTNFDILTFRKRLWQTIDNDYTNLDKEYEYMKDTKYVDLKHALETIGVFYDKDR